MIGYLLAGLPFTSESSENSGPVRSPASLGLQDFQQFGSVTAEQSHDYGGVNVPPVGGLRQIGINGRTPTMLGVNLRV
uniref:Uncharacterized protein n=1 Tax=viral metagenome TaxID=1070528 RepID=A0A6M3LNA1_9ZZZZ